MTSSVLSAQLSQPEDQARENHPPKSSADGVEKSLDLGGSSENGASSTKTSENASQELSNETIQSPTSPEFVGNGIKITNGENSEIANTPIKSYVDAVKENLTDSPSGSITV